MKKIIYLFVGLFLLTSCINETPQSSIKTVSSDNEIEIISGIDKIHYKKIKIENHDFYYRNYSTRGGTGSDLVHSPNCWCNKNNTK